LMLVYSKRSITLDVICGPVSPCHCAVQHCLQLEGVLV
jgi:hypothetical protein